MCVNVVCVCHCSWAERSVLAEAVVLFIDCEPRSFSTLCPFLLINQDCLISHVAINPELNLFMPPYLCPLVTQGFQLLTARPALWLSAISMLQRLLPFGARIDRASPVRNDSQLRHTWKAIPIQIYCSPAVVCGLLRGPRVVTLFNSHDLLCVGCSSWCNWIVSAKQIDRLNSMILICVSSQWHKGRMWVSSWLCNPLCEHYSLEGYSMGSYHWLFHPF